MIYQQVLHRLGVHAVMSSSRRVVAAGAPLLVAACLLLFVASPASASPWDPHVALTGHASCGSVPGRVTGLWLWTPQDGGQWFGFSGSNYSESYRRDYWNVPYGGTTVQYDLYCAGMRMHGSFGLARPTYGTYTTRDIYFRF